MALPWIKVHGDLMDHPRAVDLADDLDRPMAWAYLVALWAWCAQYAEHGRIGGRRPDRTAERAARWDGAAGEFVEACIANGWLARDGEELVVCGWDAHQRAHLEKAERDRQRMAERRAASRDGPATAARESRDRSATVARQSANRSATVAGERRGERDLDPPPTPPSLSDGDSAAGGAEAPTPGAVETHVVATSEAPDRGLARRRARRRWSGPATGEVLAVWRAWLELVEPEAVWSAERGALIAGWLDQGIPVARLVRAIEGYAGDADWGRGERRRLLTLERVLESPASLERGWAMRTHRDWRDPRRRQASPPPRASPPELPPPRVNGTPLPPPELPEFLRRERERRASA